jgi:hypothetical protein
MKMQRWRTEDEDTKGGRDMEKMEMEDEDAKVARCARS